MVLKRLLKLDGDSNVQSVYEIAAQAPKTSVLQMDEPMLILILLGVYCMWDSMFLFDPRLSLFHFPCLTSTYNASVMHIAEP